MGNWVAGARNQAANYSGAIFGPTSLIINNECNGEDKEEPGKCFSINCGKSDKINLLFLLLF